MESAHASLVLVAARVPAAAPDPAGSAQQKAQPGAVYGEGRLEDGPDSLSQIKAYLILSIIESAGSCGAREIESAPMDASGFLGTVQRLASGSDGFMLVLFDPL